MPVLVKIETLDTMMPPTASTNVLETKYVLAGTIGQALDRRAPSPGENAVFRITVLALDAEVV